MTQSDLETAGQVRDDTDTRVMALSIAAHAALLEDRVAFADAILPLVERYSPEFKALGYVTHLLPQGIPASQWIALAEDHLGFLLPGFRPVRPIGGLEGIRADVAPRPGDPAPLH